MNQNRPFDHVHCAGKLPRDTVGGETEYPIAKLHLSHKPIFADGAAKRVARAGQRSRHADVVEKEAGIILPCSHRAMPSNEMV